ncbi:uric acid degradation bifunctional protein TTL isoform X3 [Thrips palmi]|uniref:hydroxyisourate hydrolase n=1 Tax=Thrips palmi TaxID=161013 RepID=A0A6P9AIK6_THRPL|nr:uric acid degradation bifunctional protein TTL isoform X3 [Thrips palmi]
MEEINEIANDVMEEANADESESQHSTDDYDELEKSSCQGKYHKQSYRKAWESLPDFKGWLQGVVGQKNRAFCSYCQVTLFAHRLSLLKHTCTIKHQRASQKALLKITDDDDLGLNTVSSVGLEVEEVMEGQIDASPSKSMNMAHSSAFPLSTHVLDTSKGQPVAQLPVSLYRLIDSRWTLINESVTNQDGRCSSLIQKQEFVAGRYKLHFDTDRYFELERKETLYPFVEIAFDVHAPLDHYHIPLLLSAFGYSTYRGS